MCCERVFPVEGGTRELPGGVVSFVLTDIEGSTQLFRRLGDRYESLLDRHNELLREAWAGHDGVEVKTQGDAFIVAFHDASAAVDASVAAQRAMHTEPWPRDAVFRVRIGIHSGLAYPRNRDYVAVALHQAARVVSAGHGGQVIVSDDTAGLVDAVVRDGLVSLGRFRLRDFDEPVRLYQASGTGSLQEFPSVRALPADGHNLVRPSTSFVGRDDAIAGLGGLIGPRRVVTVVGPGGVGKTRLVIELGLGLASEWRDGVWFVDLAIVADSALVVSAVANAIGCPTSGNADLRDTVVDWLRTRQALLILDNCEHLLDATARLTGDVLSNCLEVGVLATSRQPLGVRGEHLWRLGPLATSADDRDAPAIDLFASRVRLVQPEFRLDSQSKTVVAAICARLDGLPLAIELAAPRLAVMTPAELLAGLDDRSRILRSKDRNVADRQRNLDALVSWSHELLTSQEQAAFRRLGVFAGTFDLTTAVAAVADDALSPDDVPDLVWSLAEKSLIVVEPSANATRYRFLESIRGYALGCLADAAETALSALRLTDWYLDRLGPWLPFNAALTGSRAVELDNLRALIGLVADADPARAQNLAHVVAQFHKRHGTVAAGVPETRHYLSNLLAPTPERVGLLCELAGLLVSAGEAS